MFIMQNKSRFIFALPPTFFLNNNKLMAIRTLRFALFGNIYQAKKSAFINNIIGSLKESGAEVSIDSEFYHFLVDTGRAGLPIDNVFNGNDFDADFVVSMGGDGTFLKAASRVGGKSIPIIGVNMGRLGFLADVHPEEFHNCVKALYEKKYTIEDRTVIRVTSEGNDFVGSDCALNDVAILKRDNASMITIHASINGEHLTTYQADGLIINTPTGSTGYAMAVGGAIMSPECDSIGIVPVAPQSLTVRPLMLPSKAEITLTIQSRSHSFLLSVDGRSLSLNENIRLTISQAPYKIHVLKHEQDNYFQTLRKKLMWRASCRDSFRWLTMMWRLPREE